MATIQNPAIEILVSQITEYEQKGNALKASVNYLCEKDGLPPLYHLEDGENGGGDGGGNRNKGMVRDGAATDNNQIPVQIKPDTFYGKKQMTAVREFLVIRKATNLGPAKPSEILAGLRAGGYQVEAKTDEIALVGLRAMLRKASGVFHKLPNGTWGLKEWYPGAKAQKNASAGKAAGGATSATETQGPEPDQPDDGESETPAASVA